jgi:uncharacterized protein (TIGR03086 family)
MDVATLHRRTVGTWLARLEAVADDTWSAPTPCSDWSVRELVNHVTGEELWTVPLLHGATIEEVGTRFDGDVLGDAPQVAGGTAARAASTAVDDSLTPETRVQLSYGEEAGEEYVRQLAADHLIHAWDLAVATGGDRTLDPELVAEVAGWFAEREDLYRQAGMIAPRRTTEATGEQAALLAAFGRDPDWSP